MSDALTEQLMQQLQPIIDEIEASCAQIEAEASKLQEFEVASARVAEQFPAQAAEMGLAVGRIAFDASNSLRTGLKAGGIGLVAGLAVGTIGWLGSKLSAMSAANALERLLREKKAYASEKLEVIQRLSQVLERNISMLGQRLAIEAQRITPPERYSDPEGALRATGFLAQQFIRCDQILALANYQRSQMLAWLEGRHQSNTARTLPERSYLRMVEVLLGPRTAQAQLNNGMAFLLRSDGEKELDRFIGTEAAEFRADIRRVSRDLARRRLMARLTPRSKESKETVQLVDVFLEGSSSVENARWNLGCLLFFVALLFVGLVFWGLWSSERRNLELALVNPEPCAAINGGVLHSRVRKRFKEQIAIREDNCELKKYEQWCKELPSMLMEGETKLSFSGSGALAPKRRQLLERLLEPGSLTGKDLALSKQDMPCQYSPGADASWALLISEAGKQEHPWKEADSLSEDLIQSEFAFNPEVLAVVRTRAHELSTAALGKGPSETVLPKGFCSVAERAGVKLRNCRRIR